MIVCFFFHINAKYFLEKSYVMHYVQNHTVIIMLYPIMNVYGTLTDVKDEKYLTYDNIINNCHHQLSNLYHKLQTQ